MQISLLCPFKSVQRTHIYFLLLFLKDQEEEERNRSDLLSRCAKETGSLPASLHREFTQLSMRSFPGKSAVDA
jgi:hypothetical protein